VRQRCGHFYVPVFLVAGILAACSSKGGSGGTSCPGGAAVADGCAGVPSGPLCGDSTCTDGVTCASVTTVGSDADLTNALAGATSGTCIALQPGTYGNPVLPAGVSLLGRGANDVHVDSVTVQNGGGAVVQGLEIGAGGLQIADGAQNVEVNSVLIDSTTGDAVSVGKGAQVTIAASTISSAGQGSSKGANGISSFQGGKVTLDHVFISQPLGPGLWMQACSDGCTCAGSATLAAHAIVIQGAQLVGASLAGVTATLGDVTIENTAPYQVSLMQGGGFAVSQCSTVTTDGDVTVSSNAAYGVLIDHSSATMGDSGGSTTSVTGNQEHGIWIQGVDTTQSVTLTNLIADGNAGVGIGLDGSAQSIIIQGKSSSSNTVARSLPALGSGGTPVSQSVGDGLSWNAGVEAQIDGLTLQGNARSDMLVTGQWASGSSATNLGVRAGDANCIIIQGYSGAGLIPGMSSVPSNLVSQSPSLQLAVAVGPTAPTAVIP